MAKNLKEVIIGIEDEEHQPDLFVAVSNRNSWKIVRLANGLMVDGFLEGLLFTRNTCLENIKNYRHGDSRPAYFKEHYILPLSDRSFESIMEYLQKYK